MCVCVCVCIVNTQHTTWNIKRWRWRCPCAGIGWGCVMILSRAMSCGNGCLAHPLILLPCSPPHTHHHHRRRCHHHPCFPTEQMTFMPETISPPDCRRGVFSRCTARGPNSFKLLPLTNSDFRGFHSWVDTDVLVSAIMGPLSFHANWSKKAELRGWQHGQKENLWTVFKAFLQKEKYIYINIYHTHARKLQLTRIMKVTGPIKLQMKWLSTLSQHLRRGAKRWYSVH